MNREIEAAIEELERMTYLHGETKLDGYGELRLAARARLLALLAPEPSDAEIEAVCRWFYDTFGSKAMEGTQYELQTGIDFYRSEAEGVLAAARAARQTGGAS